YLVRSLSMTPAAAIGGLLWKVVPSMPFVTAGLIGLGGTIVFAATVREERKTKRNEASAATAMPKKIDTIKNEKEKVRPRERAPIRPTRKIEDKKSKSERRVKYKKDLRRQSDESGE